ncbi:MAG: dehypoxanthine futalosine cyclase [Bacteroidetes bacterium CG2_30_33_31]|nr:MAG: dehypoxanthine futalosine cyclase [Bacteroidetes bacterium CG2_30_33_31]
MNKDKLIYKALEGEFLTAAEGEYLFKNASTPELMAAGNKIRMRLHPDKKVSWIIDRNINYTNVCNSGCQFCNFFVSKKSSDAYITSDIEFDEKINELFEIGGKQILLQGGLHPDLGINYYIDLFTSLKSRFPDLKLHALGPPEIVHISKLENISFAETLRRLKAAGLDSLPGAGAEILVDRVRNKIARSKCSAEEWLDVMREAHKQYLTTSITMMLGHIETVLERFEHLVKARQVQSEKPADAVGFISFIPWPFQSEGTQLQRMTKANYHVTIEEYVRFIALSRMMLPNIPNIQASWLTVGKQAGQLCLHAGANDFGSIMIEENVVSVAGADHSFDAAGIQRAIREAGFEPFQRDQHFESFEFEKSMPA